MIEPELFGAYNLIRNQNGTIAPNNTVISYDQNAPMYKSSFFSLGLGLNLHYSLGKHFLLSGYGRFQKPLGNLYLGSYSKTITSYSFGGGISFVFQKGFSVGSQSSILFPSGSIMCRNLPYSNDSISSQIVTPAARSSFSNATKSATL